MNVERYSMRAACVVCAIVCLLATDARAQFAPPFARYRTFETAHFIVTFEEGLDEYARRAAARAEAAHPRLARAFGSAPGGKIRLVIVDQGDLFNGSATPAPRNQIIALAHTPVEGTLFFADDPIDLLVTHELAHVFHLDQARGLFRGLRRIFGRNEVSFPHLFDGSYLIEGLATFYESSLTGGGRVRGSQFRETLRAALLETDGPKLDEAEADFGAWPPDRHYVYGSLFLDHVATRYGAGTAPAWMARRAGSLGTIFTRGAGTGELFQGKSLSQAWTDWIAVERIEAQRVRTQLQASAPGLADTRRVCDVAHFTSFPRVSPDGSTVAFLTTDEGRQPLGLYVANLQTCESRRLTRVNSAHAFAWTPDGRSIVFSQFMLVDNVRVFADLFRVEVASGAVTRLTRSARLTSPDMHPSGRSVVAVQYKDSRSRLVAVDVDSTTISPLTEFSADTAWGPARWSPDGTQLAAVRFTRGASHDLVLLSADGRPLRTLTEDRALESAPEWDASAPAGTRRMFFTSDRTGVRELYGLELEGDANPRLYLTARVPTGLHDVTLVPRAASARTVIVASVTHADGQHLERLEIDRASWVAAPAPTADYTLMAGDVAVPSLVESIAPRSYSPARDLLPTGWSPIATIGELGTFVGAVTNGMDVIGRHLWLGGAAFATDGRVLGSARYVYRRFAHAQLFGGVSSTWRIEQRIQSSDGDVVRLERERSAAVGVSVPWNAFRRSTVIVASFEIEERDHELRGDAAAIANAEAITPLPALAGGGLGLVFGNTQAGLRSISVQDGVRMSVFGNYMKSRSDERWRSGWEAAASAYRSLPSWTTSGRPVLAATVRVAEERGPAASRLTAGGIGATSVLDEGGTNFEVRGYPSGFVAANALWAVRTEARLPIARISRGLGAWPVYLRRLSGSVFADGVGAASRVDRLGSPTLLSAGVELSSDLVFFSFSPVRLRTGVGVPLKSLGPVSRGEARFYVTAGTSF